ncbi:MAG: GxxExxY protein [Leptospira sp.]|nr:GxxExxY protein [Leptospira sp.]
MTDLIYKDEVYMIQGCIFEVYKYFGNGLLESVYHEALEREFGIQNVPFKSQESIEIFYKDKKLTQTYRPDFICYGEIIVEIKAIKRITDEHRAQILNYLHLCKKRLGLLVNFGSYPKVEIERKIL